MRVRTEVLVFLILTVPLTAQTPPPSLTEYIRANGRVVAAIGNEYNVFTDVPSTASYYDATNYMYSKGITIGCSVSPRNFCPDPNISGVFGYTTRWSMSVFVIRSWSIRIWGSAEAFKTYAPPSTTPYFRDVLPYAQNAPVSDMWNANNYVSGNVANAFPYIQKMWELGFTSGCQAGNDNTTRAFCPGDLPAPNDVYWRATNRDIAVFSVRARIASDNGCTSSCFPGGDTFWYSGSQYPGSQGCPLFPSQDYFSDVPCSDSLNYKWAQIAAYYQAVPPSVGSLGCSANNFCGATTSYRGQMAQYVTRVILNERGY